MKVKARPVQVLGFRGGWDY